jgi:membrane protease YdiL (CAAX protease family)
MAGRAITGRTNAGRALLRQPLVHIALGVLGVGGAVAVGQLLLNALRAVPAFHGTLAGNALALLLLVPATALAYRAYVRLIEGRSTAEFARAGAITEVVAGFALGLGLFGAVIGVLRLLGAYRVTGMDVWTAALAALLGAAASGFIQEVLFRGLLFRIVREAWGAWWALAISASMFGLLHATSAHATVASTLAITLEAGILLGAAYLLTGRLWLAIGVHVGWDFANDGLFGTGVAGATGVPLHGLLRGELHGPALLTGGSFGVEASLVAAGILMSAGLTLLALARQRGRFTPA